MRNVLDIAVPTCTARELSLTYLAISLAPPNAFSISLSECDSGNSFDRFDGDTELFCLIWV